jgi:hypothetical protein
LHNVSAQTPANNNGIFYNTATSLWEAKSIASALGYTPANNALIISTTAPLQGGGDLSTNRTLSITQATTSTNGYLSSTDWNTFNSKQVAISFNSPLSYSLGTLSINQATTSSNGYLSSTDWNTFNGKQNALTNPITGTGTTNYIPKFTGTRAISNSLIYDNGTNVGIGTTSPTAKFQVDGGYVSITSGAVSSVGWQSNGLNFTTAASIYNGIYSPSDSVISAATSGSERMRITSGGNVGIGTTSPNYKLSVLSPNNVTWIEDTSGASGAVFALFSAPGNTGIGSIARVGTTSAIAYNSTSDYRLKEDLKEVNGLDKISKIKIYDFKWKNHTDRMDGVVAHELQEVVPYAVTGEKDGEQMQSVDYSKLVPILVQATQELKAEIEILKTK